MSSIYIILSCNSFVHLNFVASIYIIFLIIKKKKNSSPTLCFIIMTSHVYDENDITMEFYCKNFYFKLKNTP